MPFFVMLRRPPSPPLFPYTTLFRSRLGDADEAVHRLIYVDAAWGSVEGHAVRDLDAWREMRSEEHTSELQSQSNLVCRLLLEKKKKYYTRPASTRWTSLCSPAARRS